MPLLDASRLSPPPQSLDSALFLLLLLAIPSVMPEIESAGHTTRIKVLHPVSRWRLLMHMWCLRSAVSVVIVATHRAGAAGPPLLRPRVVRVAASAQASCATVG